ncbi:hypothetical protein KJ707_04485 [Patescibacteria group bacterium]|nr:hypothetical protein [Patescibacteria group bacterium]MBU2543790.1 hypothetical protein [Patescibacteria group bacterium]
MTKIEKLLLSPHTIFSVDDLAVLWNISHRKQLWESIKYYLRVGKLIKVYSGTYALHQDYSMLELAVKLFSPAYISFHTALGIHGINFQQYKTVHAMALASKKITTNNQLFIYHQLQDQIFFNELGIKQETNYRLANPERAICDSLYLIPSLTFDILDQVDQEKLLQVAKIYQNQALTEKVINLIAGIKYA